MSAERPIAQPEYRVTPVRTTSVIELLEWIPPTPGLFDKDMEHDFHMLAHTIIEPFRVTDSRGSVHYAFVSEPKTGDELIHMFYHAAPTQSASFKYDRTDVLNDWKNLYEGSHNAERLARHRTIPGWTAFEQHREAVLEGIKDRQTATIRPAIFLNRHDDGKLHFEYDADGSVTQGIEHAGHPTDSLVPMLGPAFVASLSPETRATWEQRIDYPTPAIRQQSITTAQSVPHAIWHSADLISTPLVQALVSYTDERLAA